MKIDKKYVAYMYGSTDEAMVFDSEEELEDFIREQDDDGEDVESDMTIYELGQQYQVVKSDPEFTLEEVDE